MDSPILDRSVARLRVIRAVYLIERNTDMEAHTTLLADLDAAATDLAIFVQLELLGARPPHFQGGRRKDGKKMVEATAAFRDDGGLPGRASLVFSQLVLNLGGHAGRARALELIAAFFDAADVPVRS